MTWHFSPQLPDQVELDVTQRDQFNNDEVDISETIVREAVQNSLDAAIDEPADVMVAFRWVDKNKGLDPDFFKSLFEGQIEHARVAGLDIDALNFEEPRALIIEDYGTCGLTGSVVEKDIDNFSDFWRRHGKSHKTGKKRGRWGLGKLVYSISSEIGTFFGVTRRSSDTKNHLMGQTVLNLRTVDDRQYPPHAFYSDLENEDDIFKRIPVPIRDADFVAKFEKNFTIGRGTETGLSVVIPFPNSDFDVEKMIGVAIENYFYPLITGQLRLKFDDTEISGANVRELAKKYAGNRFNDIDTLFDFIESVYLAEQKELLKLKSSWIDDGLLTESDFKPEILETIRKRFSDGELVGLYLPVTVKKKNGDNLDSGFSVYLQRPLELEKGIDLYVRGGLTLPGEAKFRERRALGAMIAEEEAVCSFLGDAENAAHTQWTTNTEKLKKNYRNTQELVTVIKKSIVQLYDLLAEITEEVDEKALQDFFWFDEPESERSRRKPRKPIIKVVIDPPPPPLFRLSQNEGGFSVHSTENLTAENLPLDLRITAAYEVSRGNAFKKYNAFDFKMGANGTIDIERTVDTSKGFVAKENKLKVQVTGFPFSLKAKGFDVNRDLKVRLTREAS